MSATMGRSPTCRERGRRDPRGHRPRRCAPLPLAPLAPEQRALVQAVKAYEELTIEAARTVTDRSPCEPSRANPLVGAEVAERFLDAILEADAEHLERFATA